MSYTTKDVGQIHCPSGVLICIDPAYLQYNFTRPDLYSQVDALPGTYQVFIDMHNVLDQGILAMRVVHENYVTYPWNRLLHQTASVDAGLLTMFDVSQLDFTDEDVFAAAQSGDINMMTTQASITRTYSDGSYPTHKLEFGGKVVGFEVSVAEDMDDVEAEWFMRLVRQQEAKAAGKSTSYYGRWSPLEFGDMTDDEWSESL